MNEKELFMEAYKKKEIKEFFKGTKNYMIYPDDAKRFVDPRKPGSGNMMYHAFKFGIIPACKDYPQLDIGNNIVDVLLEMALSKNLADFHASVLATSTILENNFEKELNIIEDKFEKLLHDIKNTIESNKEFLNNTANFYGNISFYEEFSRINDTMENGKHIL